MVCGVNKNSEKRREQRVYKIGAETLRGIANKGNSTEMKDAIKKSADYIEFLEMRWELLKLELEQSESLNAHFKNDEAVDTIHDIQSLISKMESGEYFEEFTK